MRRIYTTVILLALGFLLLGYALHVEAANNKFRLMLAPNAISGQIQINSQPVSGGTYTYECNPTCPTITLSVTPSSGKDFVQWSGGSCTGKEPVCTLVMDRDRIVSASFGAIIIPPAPVCPTPGSHVTVVSTGMSAEPFPLTEYNPLPTQVYAFEFLTRPIFFDNGTWVFYGIDYTYSGGTLVLSACPGDEEPRFNATGVCKISYVDSGELTFSTDQSATNQCILSPNTRYYVNVFKKGPTGAPTCTELSDNCRFYVTTN